MSSGSIFGLLNGIKENWYVVLFFMPAMIATLFIGGAVFVFAKNRETKRAGRNVFIAMVLLYLLTSLIYLVN